MKQSLVSTVFILGVLLTFSHSQATPPGTVPPPPLVLKVDKGDKSAIVQARQKAKQDMQKQWDALLAEIAWFQKQGNKIDPANPQDKEFLHLMRQRARFLEGSLYEFPSWFIDGTYNGSNADPEVWMATTAFAKETRTAQSAIERMRHDWGKVDRSAARNSCNSCHMRFVTGGPAAVKK